MRQITVWETNDGKTFNKKEDAANHETTAIERRVFVQINGPIIRQKTEDELLLALSIEQYSRLRSFIERIIVDNKLSLISIFQKPVRTSSLPC